MNNETFTFILIVLAVIGAITLVALYGPVVGFISGIFIAATIGVFLKVFKKFR